MLSVVATPWVDRVHAQTVFQAAGPTPASIQSTVDAFRAALGDPNNGNGPTAERPPRNQLGRRRRQRRRPDSVTPFDVFLNTRGAGSPRRGLACRRLRPRGLRAAGDLFDNPAYGDIFTTFSPLRLFTPVGSRITEACSSSRHERRDGGDGDGFGAVFTDVDKPDGSKDGEHSKHSTKIEYFGSKRCRGEAVLTGLVPSSPGEGTCRSSVSCSTTHRSGRCGSRPATPARARMTIGNTTS